MQVNSDFSRPMSAPPFSTEIRKTGFVLENEVAQLLKIGGWTVISNKHYLDDAEESVREIDLIAYRVGKVQHFDVYTVLIVSCKKSDSNAWALLSRDPNFKDPNADWWPLHTWTNDPALKHQLSVKGAPHEFHTAAKKFGVNSALALPEVEVFAFQEMDKVSGKPQNDKPIFSAVTSLMKAQAYELGALPARKKDPSIYQFNLLSIVDTDLVRLKFEGNQILQSEISSEHYLARYIVRKREMFARIRFIRSSAFEHELGDYAQLHRANCDWFDSQCAAFYSGVLEDERMYVLLEQFKARIRHPVGWLVQDGFGRDYDLSKVDIYWEKNKNVPRIGFELPDEVIEYIDESEKIRSHLAEALKRIYRYGGPFEVSYDIPF
jgi:hypothetical protein